jgi:hypothetical protein
MAYSARLCNPTPFNVKLPWDRGVVIVIEPFGATDLTMQQMDDFTPGKPGSAEVRQFMDYYGLFLLDSDRPYDNQALEALRRAHASKKSQYDSAIRNIIDRRAAAGVNPDPEALEETLRMMGYVALREKIETLKEQVAKFQEAVGDQPDRTARQQLDPKRTVFVTDPPREFPSVASMKFFLEKNPEIKARHEAFATQAVAEIPVTHEANIQSFVEAASTEQSGTDTL